MAAQARGRATRPLVLHSDGILDSMRLALVLGTAVTLLAVAPAAAGGPTLQVTSTSPVTVRGVLFIPSERVTVVAQVKERHVLEVTADATGTFIARFPDVSLGPCSVYIIRATGSRGSKAILRSVPECAQPGPAP